MKKLICQVKCFFDTFARARAATYLSRQGQHEAAKSLMSESDCCKC
jgi:hypothetical protein